MSGGGIGARLREFVKVPWAGGVAAILLLLVIDTIRDPGYLGVYVNPDTGHLVGNLIDILRAAAPVLMISVGMVLVIATSGIDLSVGSVMAVAGAASMQFLSDASAPDSLPAALTALALALGMGALCGAVNGALVSFVRLQPFISTLIMMLAARGLAKVVTSGQNARATNAPFRWIANGYVGGFPVVFVIAVLVVVAVALVVRRTALGLMVESIGIDLKAARLAGLNQRALLMTVYIGSGLLAAAAGVFATSSVMVVDVSNTGYQLEMDAILAVVIGGTSLAGGKFSISGATVGALLIVTLDKTVVFLGVPSSATPAFKAAIIIVLCLLQSQRVREPLAKLRSKLRPAGPEPKGVAA
ncbi:MAG: ABC transporter permease [Propionibacteriaceae bacterium]|jgi:simple sugar transport system permease protein|nr:ABC transporter permease [Propionibacteriaceae bacterium]